MDIETRRLFLRETYRVVDDHVKWLNDRELMKFSEQQFADHTDDTQALFLSRANLEGSPLVFDIRLKPPQDAAGFGNSVGSLHIHLSPPHLRADLGIMIGPEFARNGYGREAWNAAADFMFWKQGYEKLEAGVATGNEPMRKILDAEGWSQEGHRARHFIYDGERYGLVLYGKNRT